MLRLLRSRPLTDLRLGEHCLKIGSGATPRGGKETYLDQGPFSLIRSQNVHNDSFKPDGLAFISKAQADLLRNVEVREGDVLLNITGDSVARACQVDPAVLPARVNQHVAIIRPNPERIDPTFLRYVLVTPRMQGTLLGLASAGATRNALTKVMIEGLRVPGLHIDTQREIGRALRTIDDKIELNRRMNETLEAMAQAIFRDWFVDFGPVRRKLAGETDPVAIMGGLTPAPPHAAALAALFPDALDEDDRPAGWRTSTLADLAVHCKGSVTPIARPDTEFEHYSLPAFDSGQEPAIDVGADIKSNKTPVAEGAVLLSKLNPEIRRVWLPNPPTGREQIASTEFLIFQPRPGVGRSVLYCLFRDPTVRQILSGMVTGTSKSHQRISPPALLQTTLLVGDGEAFDAFGQIVDPMLQRGLSLRAENRTLTETRDYLLPRLMSGAVRVGDVAVV